MPTRIAWEACWSIGLYAGDSPLSLRALEPNPVLTAASVTDVTASFVADPFCIADGGTFHLFLEVLDASDGRGVIGWATSSDGRSWTYRQVVLHEPFHLSYPCIVRAGDDFYMIPETRECQAIRLYRADDFPTRWTYVADLVPGDFADATAFQHDGRWWLFAHRGLDELRLFSAPEIFGPWSEHPASPIVAGNRRISRPAGRVVTFDGRIVRFSQDGWPHYGSRIRAIEIDRLTPSEYSEHEVPESPILEATGEGWNSLGMHHLELIQHTNGEWLAVADGYTPGAFYKSR
jgi:hypothetical protein